MSRDDLDLSSDSSQDDGDALRLHGESDAASSDGSTGSEGQSPTGEVLFDNFGSPDNAGDFLGLDTELHFSTDQSSAGTIDTGFGQTEEAGSLMELESAPGTHIPAGEPGEYGEGEGEEDFFPGDEEQGELDEDEYLYEEEGVGPHKGMLVLVAFGIGALVVIGAVFGPGLLDKTNGTTPIDVADTTTTTDSTGTVDPGAGGGDNTDAGATTVDTTGETTDPTNADTATDPFFASADGVVTPPVKNGEGGSLERLFSSGAFDMVPRDLSGAGGTGPTNDVATGPAIVAVGPDTVAGNGTETSDPISIPVEIPTTPNTDASASEAALFTAGLDWATSGDVDIVWRRDSVPMDAIDAPTRVATPNVGTVRIHLTEGDFFEGKLVAVGEGNVWIQTAPGRMAFPNTDITSIEALGIELATTDPGAVNAPKRGERVRIYAPGGVIYGHVVSQNENGGVTLRTEGGGKVTIASAKIEAVGNSRAVIVQD